MEERQQVLNRIGAEIRKKRKAKGYTLFDLEAMTDISKNQLLRIEHGRANFTVYTLYKLVEVLDMDVAKILRKKE